MPIIIYEIVRIAQSPRILRTLLDIFKLLITDTIASDTPAMELREVRDYHEMKATAIPGQKLFTLNRPHCVFTNLNNFSEWRNM